MDVTEEEKIISTLSGLWVALELSCFPIMGIHNTVPA
jgi:hypothetical protein